MKSTTLKLLCNIIVVLLLLVEIGIVVEGAKAFGKDGKGPKKDPPGKYKKMLNQVPIVEIVEPTEEYVEGDSLVIVASVTDEDENAIPVIYVDMMPTFNTGNAVTVDISGWEINSEHLITAVYTDSGDKTGGDSLVVIKSTD